MSDVHEAVDRSRMVIGGETLEARSGETLAVLDPSTGAVMPGCPQRLQRTWSWPSRTPRRRLKVRGRDCGPSNEPRFLTARRVIDQRLPDLFALETANNGRPIVETRAQLSMAGNIVRYNAALAVAQRGETIDVGAG